MVSPLVQFRLAEEDHELLRAEGIDPSRAAKERLIGLCRMLRFRKDMAAIDHIRLVAALDPAAAVREAREDWEKRS